MTTLPFESIVLCSDDAAQGSDQSTTKIVFEEEEVDGDLATSSLSSLTKSMKSDVRAELKLFANKYTAELESERCEV